MGVSLLGCLTLWAGGAAPQPARWGTASAIARGSTMTKPRVAVIGTGGTIASIGKGPLGPPRLRGQRNHAACRRDYRPLSRVHKVADILPNSL